MTNTIPSLDAIGEIAIKHLKTSELIEMIARAEINKKYDFSPHGNSGSFHKDKFFPVLPSRCGFYKVLLAVGIVTAVKE